MIGTEPRGFNSLGFSMVEGVVAVYGALHTLLRQRFNVLNSLYLNSHEGAKPFKNGQVQNDEGSLGE